MDAFFVSVELLDHPELRGQPVVVGGSGPRGVVAAASYEARAFGVHSAMPSVTARRLCPHAVFLDGRHGRYSEVSRRVMAVFAEATPLVEPLSLDEAFLDVTGSERALGSALTIARRIRRTIWEREQLTCSVGIAPNKFLAKLATESAKPRATPTGPEFGPGIVEVDAAHVDDFLRPLPVGAIWGVGPKTLERLGRLGIQTVADLADVPLAALCASVGNSAGRHLHELAHGRDARPVMADVAAKSISHEETFPSDRFDRDGLEAELTRMSDAVASRLRSGGVVARTVTLKVRSGAFETATRARTLADPTDDGLEVARCATGLLAEVDISRGVRLVGVGATNLVEARLRQRTLVPIDDEGSSPAGRDEVNRTVDSIRARYGSEAIGPARLTRNGRVRTFRTGEQQWGPGRGSDDAGDG
jgi:DNA polymerase-4